MTTDISANFLRNLATEPWRFDYFAVLRELERSFRELPRIGDSAARREEFVQLGQDPFLDFPSSNLARVESGDGRPLKIFVKYLGLLGPQGALPLATTEEAYHYALARDDAFPRFLDIFNHRFLQLFYRAWADSRPIVQHDRPEADRFLAYIGSTIGIGSAPCQNHDSIPDAVKLDSLPDAVKLGFAGLLGAQVKCASRLAGAIRGMFRIEVEIEEFVGTFVAIDPAECSTLGQGYNRLGNDLLLGGSVFSVQDKIRVRLFAASLAQYMRFLPTGDLCERLADLVFFYNGDQLDWDTELAIAAGAVEPARLGTFGQLGWTSWMSQNWTSTEPYRRDARFHPAAYRARKREARKDAKTGVGSRRSIRRAP